MLKFFKETLVNSLGIVLIAPIHFETYPLKIFPLA